MQSNSLFLFFILTPYFCFSQNLVSNSSFETVTFYENNLDASIFENRTAKFDDWEIWHAGTYCNCQHKYLKINKYLDSYCKKDLYTPKDGCNMMGMIYQVCRTNEIGQVTKNCSNYIYTKLKQPLDVGSIYRISVWFYLPSDQINDKSLPNQIGIAFYRDKPIFYREDMFPNQPFMNYSVEYNRWFEQVWYIRPTCNLNYLMLGVFQSENWAGKMGNKVESTYYYIDDIHVEKVLSDSLNKNIPITYCKEKEHIPYPKITETNSLSIYYEPNSDVINDSMFYALDSVGTYMKRFPKCIFNIIGHTDDVGSNHLELSNARCYSVRNYLVKKFKINPIRFVIQGVGNNDPISSDKSDAARRAERRVDIFLSRQLSIENIYYRNAINYTKNEKFDSAFVFLYEWAKMALKKSWITALFDTRLEPLHFQNQWEKFKEKIIKSYKNNFEFKLDSLKNEESRYRSLEYHLEHLTSLVGEKDSFEFNFPMITQNQWDSLDNQNIECLNNLLQTNPFPTETTFGEELAAVPFSILSHCVDAQLLQNYLPKIKKLCLKGESQWIYYATLVDKLHMIKNETQEFGYQYERIKNTNSYKKYKHIGLSEMNKNREKYGLEILTNKELNEIKSFIFTHLKN